jgi:hypothetical protein
MATFLKPEDRHSMFSETLAYASLLRGAKTQKNILGTISDVRD